MILYYVAYRAGCIVKFAAFFDPKLFRHRDLYALDIVPIPDWLEKAVGKPEEQKVEHRFLAQVVINSKDATLRQDFVQRGIQFLCGLEITAERLFDNDAGMFQTIRLG